MDEYRVTRGGRDARVTEIRAGFDKTTNRLVGRNPGL